MKAWIVRFIPLAFVLRLERKSGNVLRAIKAVVSLALCVIAACDTQREAAQQEPIDAEVAIQTLGRLGSRARPAVPIIVAAMKAGDGDLQITRKKRGQGRKGRKKRGHSTLLEDGQVKSRMSPFLPYHYVRNNPLNLIDPAGLQAIVDDASAFIRAFQSSPAADELRMFVLAGIRPKLTPKLPWSAPSEDWPGLKDSFARMIAGQESVINEFKGNIESNITWLKEIDLRRFTAIDFTLPADKFDPAKLVDPPLKKFEYGLLVRICLPPCRLIWT